VVICADENQDSDTDFLPIFTYEYVSLNKQSYYAPGTGFLVQRGDTLSEDRDSLLITAIYKPYIFMDDYESSYSDYPDMYHSINFMIDREIDRHLIIVLLSSFSNEPVSGGLHTFTAGLGYGYEFLRNKNVSLTLGAGLAVSDFGIKLPDDTIWPVLPVPLIRFNVDFPWITATFEYLTKPALDITIAPKQRVRMTGTFSMEEYRDIRDFFFNCELWYRFFSEDSDLGDFMGISLGIKNDGIYFLLPKKDDAYELSYYSVFSTLDISFLQLSGGYIFAGMEIYNLKYENRRNIGKGFFISVQASYKF
jgi:hypothetical protein